MQRSLSLFERIHGCWLGKSIGGTLGLPAEGRMERLQFTYYEPVPTEAPPNDDLELQLVWLDLLERCDGTLTQADLARAWLAHLHYMWDEYGRCRWNLRRGVPVAAVGTFENPFASGMGSPIRSEIWACVFPGDPASAAVYGALDASLDHGLEGVAGEVLFATMQSLVCGGASAPEAIKEAIGRIPSASETARAVALVMNAHARRIDPWLSRERLLAAHADDNFTHAPLNVALTIWALLHGEGDFEKSILLAVNGGYDTDCTAATVGATIGLAIGDRAIPSRWKDPIGEAVFVGPGVVGIRAPATLAELTERTASLAGKIPRRTWDELDWHPRVPAVDLARLPGTVSIRPLGGGAPVAWANGELPEAVKRAGGAEWDWTPAERGQMRFVVALARSGMKFFIDDTLVVDCPAGRPYVPAPHRTDPRARTAFTPARPSHRVRVELGSRTSDQKASVLLAYPNLHIAPWSACEIPWPACLGN